MHVHYIYLYVFPIYIMPIYILQITLEKENKQNTKYMQYFRN